MLQFRDSGLALGQISTRTSTGILQGKGNWAPRRASANRPDSLRGVGLDFAVLDEYADMRPETWSTVIRPMLSDRNGGALCIGTPRGLNHFYDFYVEAGQKSNWARFHFSTEEGGYVSPEEQAAARAEMDRKRYAQEYQASFETLQGRVYYEFDRGRNVTKLDLLPNAPLMIGMDFNVNPMTAVVAQRSGDQCQIIHEMVLTNSNTQEMMDEINRKYQGRQGAVHPDPSGSARKTSARRPNRFHFNRASGLARIS